MRTVLKPARPLFLAVCCIAVAACQTTAGGGGGSFCERRPAVCFLLGAVVVGGVVAIATDGGGSSSVPQGGDVGGTGGNTGGGNVGNASDARLKTELRFVEKLDNGINLYAFRYIGDDRLFVGVNAAEIQSDTRFAHAIRDAGHGYLGADYRALGLLTINDAEMHSAGADAVARALAK